jgi:hypothetical protein
MGVIDILPSCVSSVYFMWEKEYEKFSLGKVSYRTCEITTSDPSNVPVERLARNLAGQGIARCWRPTTETSVYGSEHCHKNFGSRALITPWCRVLHPHLSEDEVQRRILALFLSRSGTCDDLALRALRLIRLPRRRTLLGTLCLLARGH